MIQLQVTAFISFNNDGFLERELKKAPVLPSNSTNQFQVGFGKKGPLTCGQGNIRSYQSVSTDTKLIALISQGQLVNAVDYLYEHKIQVDNNAYALLVRDSGNSNALLQGKRIHAYIIKYGLQNCRIYLHNLLIDMYRKLWKLEDACAVFDQMPGRNVFTWTTMFSTFVQYGLDKKVLQVFLQMQQEGHKPDQVAFITVLKSCCGTSGLVDGKIVHAHVIQSAFYSDKIVGNALLNMYNHCGSLEEAAMVFGKMNSRDVVSWTTIIMAYALHGNTYKAISLLEEMQQEDMEPNRITFISILNAFGNLEALAEGKLIHAHSIGFGFGSDAIVGSALVNMYGKCSNLDIAQEIFQLTNCQDVVAWNSMIGTYLQHEQFHQALELFQRLQQVGIQPTEVTFSTILSACSSLTKLAKGKLVHSYIAGGQLETNVVVGTALVHMYGKCGSLEDAWQAFTVIFHQNVISWNALIAAHVQHEYCNEAVDLFHRMQCDELHPNFITFSTVLNACGSIAILVEGRLIHACIIRLEAELDVALDNALLNMYGKSGNLEASCRIFEMMPGRDLISWNAMIACYALHGQCNEAIQIFKQMQLEYFHPDEFSFASILSACSHVGMVDNGCYYFISMGAENGITRMPEHYGCMIDLLGRMGWVDEAEDFIDKMVIDADLITYNALFSGCRVHGNLKQGAFLAQNVFKRWSNRSGDYVQLANIYAAVGMLEMEIGEE